MKLTGGAVVSVAGLLVAVGAVYFIRKKLAVVGEAVGYVLELPVQAFNAVNNAVPPGVTFDQVQDDGTVKKITVSGEQIKRANVNPMNMGMVQWPSSSESVSPWVPEYDPAGYDPFQAQKIYDFMTGKDSVIDLIEPEKKWSMFGG